MRTPNCECIICGKKLYRRPFELKKVRYVACIEHRTEAAKLFDLTEKQLEALNLGRQTGDNHLTGIPKSEESKRKRSIAMKRWCSENIDAVYDRAEKISGENHYNWKGGLSSLNKCIRESAKFRQWALSVYNRDNYKCVKCYSTESLEAHHIVELSIIISKFNIKNLKEAKNREEIWDISNGITLCTKCHYDVHGRTYNGHSNKPPTYCKCINCGIKFRIKPSEIGKRKFCSKECRYGNK